MYSALLGTDPVIFFESQRLYDLPEMFETAGVPEGRYEIPFGEPSIKKAGKDLTILTIGATLYRAIDAAKELETKYGVSCEVIDARSIVPFNYAKVIESVKKTRKILLTSDACERGSSLQTMAAKITQFAFDELDAPPVVVGARNWVVPADEVEDAFFPFPSDMIDAVHTHIIPLKGYTPARECSTADLLRRSAEGV
jgi:2-oxoisovalerate dehydrogenase E1 component